MNRSSQALWENALTAAERVAVCRPLLPSADRLLPYLKVIDETRRYSNHGTLLLALQQRLSEAMGGNFVALASSGTTALEGAILASAGRARPQRHVCLMPAFTFIGSVAAVERCGFEPHFVDVDPETWMLDPRYLLNHPRLDSAGLVLAVSAFGRKVDQAPWTAFRDATSIPVVIDGAAMVESTFASPAECIGDIPVALSFHATKAFAIGEGGAVVTSSERAWRSAMAALNFGFDGTRLAVDAGVNGKMSEYHAAIGHAELDGWAEKLSRYRKVSVSLREACEPAEMIVSPAIGANYAIARAASDQDSVRFQRRLELSGIGYRRWYGDGAHLHPHTMALPRDQVLPITEELSRTLIGLPMSVDLSAEDISLIGEAVREVFA